MVRTYLNCDICGDKWDITETNYARIPYPGTRYVHDCVKKSKRTIIIHTGKVTVDDRLELDEMDICDKCYNKIDRFIYDLTKGAGEDDII